MKKLIDEKYLTAIVIVSIVAFPLLELIGIFFNKQFFMQEEYLSLVGLIWSIVMIIYIVLCIFKKKVRPKKFVLSDLFIITSILFCIISIIFSKAIIKSLTGYPNYRETPLQVLGYFGLFFICTMISEEKNKKKILYTFLVLGIFETIVAFLQNFSMWPVTSYLDPNWHTKDHLAFGLTQHCNFFAPIAVIFTALFSMKFIYSKSTKEKIIYIMGTILCASSALFTYTRLAWVRIICYTIWNSYFRNIDFYKNQR